MFEGVRRGPPGLGFWASLEKDLSIAVGGAPPLPPRGLGVVPGPGPYEFHEFSADEKPEVGVYEERVEVGV